MKYETLLKGLITKRDKCLSAGDKPSWYQEEKEKLTKALDQLEERCKKSALSNEVEIKALNSMIDTVKKLMNPKKDVAEQVSEENVRAAASDITTSNLSGTFAETRELPDPPSFLRREARMEAAHG